ncbi:hypothetical protein MtrunA17_Chr8g0342961 [Medicago truncatula]|uniref:Uncharacterized protein n=1 Tax=Medicago truncatula TaxID=3880 RepID=A0A396GD19_MEDTR|nr:hypothetical protein MtrunA17_Chr8g0342961 [Medicago truncatula]
MASSLVRTDFSMSHHCSFELLLVVNLKSNCHLQFYLQGIAHQKHALTRPL